MAVPDILRGTYVSLLLGDGGSPTEVFAPICGIKTRRFTAQGNTNNSFTRDCADPESIPHRRIIITGEQWDLAGSGDMNRAQLADLQAAYLVQKNWRLVFGEPADDEVFGGYYKGPAILTQMQFGGDDDGMASIDLTIASDGPWVWVDSA